MKYQVSVYLEEELKKNRRIEIEEVESKAVEAFYSKIGGKLKESITKSVKVQLADSNSDEIELNYDINDFIEYLKFQ